MGNQMGGGFNALAYYLGCTFVSPRMHLTKGETISRGDRWYIDTSRGYLLRQISNLSQRAAKRLC
jgi:hypothetical protein